MRARADETGRPVSRSATANIYTQKIFFGVGSDGYWYYPLNQQVMLIGSGGRDRSAVSGKYTVAGFDPTDSDQDIIWADGFFVRWPQK